MPRQAETDTQIVEEIFTHQDVKLWHDVGEVGYATVGDRETWPIHSLRFEKFIRGKYMEAAGEIASQSSVACIQKELSSRALDGPLHDPQIRVNEHGGKLYLNMGDWRVVEIGPDGWAVLDHAMFPIIRQPHSLVFPDPERGGTIADLRPFVNADDKQFKMVVAYILAALRKSLEYPILFLHGAPDVGKTTMTNLISSLVDPTYSTGADLPSDKKDLGIHALHRHLVAFDNLSKLSFELSDAMCRMGTGYTAMFRKLYSNNELFSYTLYRPIIFNGIADVIWRDDLARRAIVITLDSPKLKIGPDRFKAAFENARPRIFGALLNALSCAMGRYHDIVLPDEKVYGLRSVAEWAEAAAPSLGWGPGEFTEIYNENQLNTSQLLMEADVLAKVVSRFMEDKEEYYGNYDRFMTDCVLCREVGKQGKWAFENSKTFFSALDRLKNGLSKNGIDYRRQGVVDGKQQFSLRKI